MKLMKTFLGYVVVKNFNVMGNKQQQTWKQKYKKRTTNNMNKRMFFSRNLLCQKTGRVRVVGVVKKVPSC